MQLPSKVLKPMSVYDVVPMFAYILHGRHLHKVRNNWRFVFNVSMTTLLCTYRFGAAADLPPASSSVLSGYFTVNVKMTYNYLGANRALNGAVYIADPTTGVGLKCPGWDNGSYCGTAGHHTSQNRCFAHMHTAPAAFPYQICKMLANGQLQGLEAGPDINSLTGLTLEDTDPIKDYYIDYYAANREAIETDTPSGDVDFTTNCFGYVFGKSTWVNDPQFLFDDDATSEAYPVAGGAGRQGTITHGYKVIAVWDPGASGGEIFPTLKVTKDKFRESQLWREDFASPGRTANAAQHKLK